MVNTLAGFWSYVHADNEYERDRIVRLRGRLQQSVQFHTGATFEIFLDKDGIGWGQQWEERIRTSLSDALVLFPIITPSYFSSKPCRDEFLAFRQRQKALGRDDLILPIYYLTSEMLEGHEGDADPDQLSIAQYILDHQHEDFRSLRASEETDPSYAQAMERLGQRVADVLKRGRELAVAHKIPDSDKNIGKSGAEEVAPREVSDPQLRENSTPGHVTVLSINQMPGRGDFTSVTEAVARAPGGARLMIAAGHYRENVVIDKPLELIGNGLTEDIVIDSDSGEPLTFDTNIGLIRNLTIRQTKIRKEIDIKPAGQCNLDKAG
jgi:hypothetical protein